MWLLKVITHYLFFGKGLMFFFFLFMLTIWLSQDQILHLLVIWLINSNKNFWLETLVIYIIFSVWKCIANLMAFWSCSINTFVIFLLTQVWLTQTHISYRLQLSQLSQKSWLFYYLSRGLSKICRGFVIYYYHSAWYSLWCE